MTSPLYDYLVEKAAKNEARFHMPGHKGVPILNVAPETIDFTELSDTGDLMSDGNDIIKTAETLAAADYKSNGCVFSAGGSTLGIQACMAAITRDETARFGQCAQARIPMARCGHRALLAARDAHRSFFHTLALLDADADYLPAGSSATEYEKMLESGKYSAVYITSPNYYGFLADTDGIYNVCKRHGVPLILDAAHGSHLEWLGIPLRADYVIMSAHKTLTALGGASMVHTYGNGNAVAVRKHMKIFGSSSPSYLILASLDRALGLLRADGGCAYRQVAEATARLADELDVAKEGDPCRLVVPYTDGFAAARELEALGVIPEMADSRNVVFIITVADVQLARLRDALLSVKSPRLYTQHTAPTLPPIPQKATTVRAALFGETETVLLSQAEGRTAAAPLAPYPPGVPVVAPGEVIGAEHIAFLREMCYNNDIKVVAIEHNKTS